VRKVTVSSPTSLNDELTNRDGAVATRLPRLQNVKSITASATAAAATTAVSTAVAAATTAAIAATATTAVAAPSAATTTAAAAFRLRFVNRQGSAAEIFLVVVCNRFGQLLGVDVDKSKASSLDDANRGCVVFREVLSELVLRRPVRQVADVKCFCSQWSGLLCQCSGS